MKLADLTDKILKRIDGVEEFDHITNDYIYKSIDFRGNRNQNLANPLNQEKSIYYLRQRDIPLTGVEEIDGKYLLFTESSHDEFTLLEDFDSLFELEAAIISDSGEINPFTTYSVAFINGEIRDYEITFFDITQQKRIVFVKEAQGKKIESDEYYAERKIKWI